MVVPEIVPALATKGLTVMAIVDGVPSPQEFEPLTVILPEIAEEP